ncbi:MAG: ATP-binding cassette domain-containing protein [Archaeoglobaceae archaeon]|nr:ATP-binding cassette domain-containing protein [Archaeoglobaceae archaeon]
MSLKVSDGEISVVVGLNGSSKSTLLKIIAGILKADEVKVIVDGEIQSVKSAEEAFKVIKKSIFQN